MVESRDLIIPNEWEQLAKRMLSLEKKGCAQVMVIGGVDSGKTTLCKYLLGRACEAGFCAALVDADVGQSTLGPPSTIGAKIFHKGDEVFGDDVRPPFLRFVGGTSPAGRIYACVTGARKALDWACENGAGLAVVDTTGLIAGEPGRELKTLKIDVLEPDLIIGISREAELDHILAPHERMGRSVVRLRRVEAVTARSPAVRQQFRLQKFQEYFKPSCLQELPLDKLVIADCPYNFAHHFAPEQIMSTQPALDRGVLLALLVGLETAGGQCLAVGIIKEFDSEGRRATVRAPKVDIDAVRCVRIGRSGIE